MKSDSFLEKYLIGPSAAAAIYTMLLTVPTIIPGCKSSDHPIGSGLATTQQGGSQTGTGTGNQPPNTSQPLSANPNQQYGYDANGNPVTTQQVAQIVSLRDFHDAYSKILENLAHIDSNGFADPDSKWLLFVRGQHSDPLENAARTTLENRTYDDVNRIYPAFSSPPSSLSHRIIDSVVQDPDDLYLPSNPPVSIMFPYVRIGVQVPGTNTIAVFDKEEINWGLVGRIKNDPMDPNDTADKGNSTINLIMAEVPSPYNVLPFDTDPNNGTYHIGVAVAAELDFQLNVPFANRTNLPQVLVLTGSTPESVDTIAKALDAATQGTTLQNNMPEFNGAIMLYASKEDYPVLMQQDPSLPNPAGPSIKLTNSPTDLYITPMF